MTNYQSMKEMSRNIDSITISRLHAVSINCDVNNPAYNKTLK